MFIQTKNCLEEKIIDAIIDEPEYVPTLRYKKRILNIHFFSILSFVFSYFILIFVFKYQSIEYRTPKFIFIMTNYSDLFLLIIFCCIYFPRELPPQFIEQDIYEPEININYEENDYFENIYSYEQIDEENILKITKLAYVQILS